MLTWAAAVLQESGKKPDPAVNTAIMRIAPTLRSLRNQQADLVTDIDAERLGEDLADRQGIRPGRQFIETAALQV